METKETSVKNEEIEKDEFEDLESFLKMKKAQTKVLKKIIEKLNTDEKLTLNK